MKTTYLLFINLTLMISLYAQKSVYELKINNENKLPALDICIDQDDIAKAYLTRQIISNKEIEDDAVEEEYQSSIFVEDHKIEDTQQLFERFLTMHIISSSKESTGKVEMNVTYYDFKTKVTLGTCLCVISFGAAVIVGVPVNKSRTDVEVELKIFNQQDDLLYTYYGVGRDNFRTGLYMQKQDQRSSNIIALKNALYDINDQMQEQFSELDSALLMSTIIE